MRVNNFTYQSEPIHIGEISWHIDNIPERKVIVLEYDDSSNTMDFNNSIQFLLKNKPILGFNELTESSFNKIDYLVISSFSQNLDELNSIITQSGPSRIDNELWVKNTSNDSYHDNFSESDRKTISLLNYKDYLSTYKEKFKLYENNWDKLGDKAPRRDVINIKPTLTRVNPETGKKEVIRIKDSQKKRQKIWVAGMKIRIINPNISKWELLYNLTDWMYKYTSKGKEHERIKWEDMFSITNNVINHDIELYKKKRLEVLKNPDYIHYNPNKKEK